MKKLSEVPEAIPHAALWHGNDLGYSLSTIPPMESISRRPAKLPTQLANESLLLRSVGQAVSPYRRRLTRRQLFNTQVVGASVHFRSAPQTPPLAKTLKPEDIVRPTMGVELSLHVLRSSRETVA
jgi:hypothetical protein